MSTCSITDGDHVSARVQRSTLNCPPPSARTLRLTASAITLRALALLATLVLADRASSQCQYEAAAIQPAPCPIFGIPATFVGGVSDATHVVGWHCACGSTDDVAFVWTAETGLIDIPFPMGSTERRALGVNSTGRVVGHVNLPDDGLQRLAFIYENGELMNLGTLPGGNFSEAVAVNEAGQIAGSWGNTVSGPAGSFFWEDGVISNLDLPFGPSSEATDIGPNGGVVGWMGTSVTFDSRAYLWHDGVATDIGKPPDALTGQATAIDGSGQVLIVGGFQNPEGTTVVESFVWKAGQWTPLALPAGYDSCFGMDLNDTGQVVGICANSDLPQFQIPFLWQNGTVTPVQDLVITPDAIPGFPIVINNQGLLVATGSIETDHAALALAPLDQPVGDLDHDCAVGVTDFLQLLAAWGPCPDPPVDCHADLDGDGSVGIPDFLALLANWG